MAHDEQPFSTTHRFITADTRSLAAHLDSASVDLVVTSPPYPMITMWDELFRALSPNIATALDAEEGNRAFELMHGELDKVWRELFRLVRGGGFVCINIGDAVRTVAGAFQLYPNHARIVSGCRAAGFETLPLLLWRKTTNAPNKFMGSGMLPAGAYVTLEHEYILLFRKGGKRQFGSSREKERRMESAFFWEERNSWFSDIWDLKGVRQSLGNESPRERSAAFTIELPWRLVQMYSLYGDTVLDPFAGTATTMLAALGCGRNSIGIDLDAGLFAVAEDRIARYGTETGALTAERYHAHKAFVTRRTEEKGAPLYTNVPHGFPVMTRQETQLRLRVADAVICLGNGEYRATYRDFDLQVPFVPQRPRLPAAKTVPLQTELEFGDISSKAGCSPQ
jgi:modification methylase